MTIAGAVGRNEHCPCGSGKRFKHCCGALAPTQAGGTAAAPLHADEASRLMHAALAEQQARRLDEAECLYREALALSPDAADALHMLGVIRYEKHDYAEARTLIMRALELTGWRIQSFRHNFGLVIARANDLRRVRGSRAIEQRYRERMNRPRFTSDCGTPAVGIVVPAYNHERYIAAALRSAFSQSYRNIELVVIDDGSSDATFDIASEVLAEAPFAARLLRRDNRGAATTINEGIALLETPYISILNSDDEFHPDRIALLVEAVAGAQARWGFSGVEFIDSAGTEIDTLEHPRAYALSCALAEIPYCRSIGYALLASNVCVSTGNLFFARRLWEELEGFRDLRYNHDWDYALRALWLAEPELVRTPLYRYRLHARNTIAESDGKPVDEAGGVVRGYVDRAAGAAVPPNCYAPSRHGWGAEFAIAMLESGVADALDAATMRRLVEAAEEPADGQVR